jgi:hypothetical protein
MLISISTCYIILFFMIVQIDFKNIKHLIQELESINIFIPKKKVIYCIFLYINLHTKKCKNNVLKFVKNKIIRNKI